MPLRNQNSQKIFQPILSEPTVVAPRGRETPSGAPAAVAQGIAGLTTALNILASQPSKADKKLRQNIVDFEQQLGEEAQLIIDPTSGTVPPSGVASEALEEIEQIGEGVRQGRIPQADAITRLGTLVQQRINADPQNAQFYRDAARRVLGFDPAAAFIADKIQDQEEEEERQQQIVNDLANVAIRLGLFERNETGGIDIDATALLGAKHLQEEAARKQTSANIELELKRLQLQKNRQLTKEEEQRIQFRVAQDALKPFLVEISMRANNAAQTLVNSPDNQNLSSAEQTRSISQELAVIRADVIQTVNEFALEHNLEPEVKEAILNDALSQLAPVNELLTGDFSDFETTQRILNNLNATNAIDIFNSAPLIARFKAAGGDPAVTALLGQVAFDKNIRSELTREVSDIVAEETTPLLDVWEGVNPNDLSRKEKANATKTGIRYLNQINKRPQAMDEQTRELFKVTNGSLIEIALNAPVADRARGVKRLSSESNIASILFFAPQDSEVRVIGAALRTLNAQVFAETARATEPETPPLQLAKTVLARGKVSPTTFFPVYDAEKQEIVIKSSLKNKVVTSAPRTITKQVELMNENLRNIVKLKQLGDDTKLNELNDAQIKQALVLATGSIDVINEDALEELPGGLAGVFQQ